jgi:hypothetical protein
MAISHRGYITKFQTKREILVLCHWWGLTQKFFWLGFLPFDELFFFKMAKFSNCQISNKKKNHQITYEAVLCSQKCRRKS